MTVSKDIIKADCGEAGKLYRDAYQAVLFEKQIDESKGKEYWSPVCVGALLPGKYENYTDTLYISSGCIRDDPRNYVVRYGTDDPIDDTKNMRTQFIAVFDRSLPENGITWNYGLSVAKFMPDALGPTVKTVCLPGARDNGPQAGSKCRLGAITQSGKLATLPLTIVPDSDCRNMPSYGKTEIGEDIPYDPKFQICGKELDMERTFAHFKSHVGPVVCENKGRQTLYGYFLIEPPTLKTGDPFRMTRIQPHMEFVNEMKNSYLSDLIASMAQQN
ncbi:hypothetical protein D918_06825 [Trichuris suis]|nr:hypothetical protein D918_06825 [Trichuris suis]